MLLASLQKGLVALSSQDCLKAATFFSQSVLCRSLILSAVAKKGFGKTGCVLASSGIVCSAPIDFSIRGAM